MNIFFIAALKAGDAGIVPAEMFRSFLLRHRHWGFMVG
jgi:hypothetical protein